MKKILVILVAILILGYGGFEARRLIAGPEITILSPINGTATSSQSVIVSGIAKNISFLTINDNPAFTDEAGHFFEVVSSPPGYAIFTVAARDRFGRKTSAEVRVSVLNYCPVTIS